jgi:3-dehydroquinate dehydratase type II
MRNVIVVNGPNLNLLGTREPDVYGSDTLSAVEARVVAWGTEIGLSVETFQSNHEGELIDRLHRAREYADGVVLNAGALTHYSYALHDAVKAIGIPTVEVHISNINAREEWRRTSVVGPACVYSIFGRGLRGYRDALHHLLWREALPPLTASYGDDTDQVADLRVPVGSGPFPVAVIIHGGFWRDVWTRDIMDGIAVDLVGKGWATWNIEYRRVGTGGGWPETVEDAAAAIDALAGRAAEYQLDLSNVVAVGHSAGGQLALWAAAREAFTTGLPGAVPRVHLAAVVGLAPVADLTDGHERSIGNGAVAAFLGRDPEDGPNRYRAASPAALLPLGVKQVIIHGEADDEVPVGMSESYAGAAADAGDHVVYRELADVGHYEVLEPSSAAWKLTAGEISELHRAG